MELNIMSALRALSVLTALAVVCTHMVPAQKAGIGNAATSILWTPPAVGWTDNMPKPSFPREMIGSLMIGSVSIALEKTTLEEVKKRFGGPIGSRGDAGDSLAWVCFQGGDEGDRWMLWLTSGEISGLSEIDGFQWRRLESNQLPDRRCIRLHENRSVELPSGLRLGTTRTEVNQIMGKPTLTVRSTFYYMHEHTISVRSEPYTVDNDVAVTFHNGVAWIIDASRITSN